MSDLAAAAEAVGAPEEMVQRSAEARAQADGTSVEEVLAAWAGGGGGSAAPAESEADEAAPETPPEETAETPAEGAPEEEPAEQPDTTPSAAPAPAAAAEPAAAAPSQVEEAAVTAIPILESDKADQPLLVVLGAVAVFALTALLGFVFPSLPADSDQVVTSNIAFSESAIEGRTLYQQLDCASCHTQMVRPVVADVALGPVTLEDTNQVLGVRRIGPDLSYVGSRLDPAAIRAIITGGGNHPAVSLAEDDLDALTSYLTESRSENVETDADE